VNQAADSKQEHLDAKAAAGLLGVKPQTLYAYVSRGLIRTEPKPGSKERRYHREDLDFLRLKGRNGLAPTPTAERSLHFGGSAILLTTITSVTDEGPIYRGWPAVELIRQHRCYEDCVELLWVGVLPKERLVWKPLVPSATMRTFTDAMPHLAGRNNSRRLMALAVAAYASCIGRSAEHAYGPPVLAARQLIQVMAPVLGVLGAKHGYEVPKEEVSIAGIVAHACRLQPTPEILHAIDSCLIACADHELAPSTFAARIAASAGADIFACVTSALGAFEGPLTGMGCDDAERSIREASSPKAYLALVRQKRERRETLSGYGHPLYANGDPRGALLLERARELAGRNVHAQKVFASIDAVSQETGLLPNLSIGLVAMAAALKMPPSSPGALMALGRTAGWVAHVFEQRLAGLLVRPRARYVGPAPIRSPH